MPKYMLDSGSVPKSSAFGPSECEGEYMSLECLPDELISMCYCSLPARDLVTLELVCRRLRDLVCGDENAWKACAEVAWGSTHNFDLMNMAVTSAGTWKALYATKKAADISHAPWNVPSTHEVRAIMERTWSSDATELLSTNCHPWVLLSLTPRSVIFWP
jgi:F-box domain